MTRGAQKMAKTKNRIKKKNFQQQNREYAPLSDNDKYIIELAGYRRGLMGKRTNEDIPRTTRGTARPQHI